MSRETKTLEDALAAKKKTVLSLSEKIAELSERIEKASFERKPALREELSHVTGEHAKAEAAVTEAEARLARARSLDDRDALRRSFETVNERAGKSAEAARQAVREAVRAMSEACALGQAAVGLARNLGGAPLGYIVNKSAISAIGHNTFELMYVGVEVVHMDRVLWPTIRADVDVPAIRVRPVSSEERETHLALDAELAVR